MHKTKNRFGLKSTDCITYRGYYILTNHDDSHMAVTSNMHDILFVTSSLCAAYTYIDKLIDTQIADLAVMN